MQQWLANMKQDSEKSLKGIVCQKLNFTVGNISLKTIKRRTAKLSIQAKFNWRRRGRPDKILSK